VRLRAEVVRRCCGWVLFGLVPVVVTVTSIVAFASRRPDEPDFGTFWLAGRLVLHHHSPYLGLASLPSVASPAFSPFVYPPLAAFMLAPFGMLPFLAAKLAFLVANLGAVVLALRLLGVRDWRCYGIAFASPPVIEATSMGTISILLLVGLAAAWRYRERAVAAGVLVAAIVSAKLFLWPVWFWLVRTGRRRAAGIAVGVSVLAVATSWAAIGFAGLRAYPTLLGRLTGLEGVHSYSTYALQRALGVGDGHAAQATYAIGLAALALALRLVRDDRRALIALIGVSLTATPILWPHYLVLLFVPAALMSSTLAPVWLVPLLLWANTSGWSDGHAGTIILELALTAVTIGIALRGPIRSADRRVRPSGSSLTEHNILLPSLGRRQT